MSKPNPKHAGLRYLRSRISPDPPVWPFVLGFIAIIAVFFHGRFPTLPIIGVCTWTMVLCIVADVMWVLGWEKAETEYRRRMDALEAEYTSLLDECGGGLDPEEETRI
jgi:hypothetical protein